MCLNSGRQRYDVRSLRLNVYALVTVYGVTYQGNCLSTSDVRGSMSRLSPSGLAYFR